MDGILKGKSPLRSARKEPPVWYWFLEDSANQLTNDAVWIDEVACLPREVFLQLSLEKCINDICCMYHSRAEAFEDLERAWQRTKRKL